MQLLNFLVSVTCFFLLLFSIHLLFAKKGNKRQNLLLAALFFARFGQILTSLLITSAQKDLMSILFQSFTPLYFAAPACFYLYITGYIHNRKALTRAEYLHFIPALLALIHVIPWPESIAINWNRIASQLAQNGYLYMNEKTGLFPAYFHYVFRPALSITYLTFTWIAVFKSKINKKTTVNDPNRRWVLFLLKVTTFFQVAALSPILLRSLQIPLYNSFFIVANCIVLLAILMYAIHQPQIFYGHLLVAIDWDKNDLQNKPPVKMKETSYDPLELGILTEPKIKLPSKRLNLSVQQTSLYAVLIQNAMENEQLYLQPDLQIIDLATRINIPVHHCSAVINNHIGKNFRDWINAYRIEHFLKLYPLKSDKMTIEAIAQEAGFKSQATFYNAFKKEKGIMPTNYFSQGLPNDAI